MLWFTPRLRVQSVDICLTVVGNASQSDSFLILHDPRLLDSVLTPGIGGGGGESAVDALQVYYHFKLNHVQVTVPATHCVERTVDLIEKYGLHKAYMDLRTDATKAAFFGCSRLFQQWLPEMQDAWTTRKAEEIQGYEDRNEMKNFFKATKAIYGPCIKRTAPLLSSDGTTWLTEKLQIRKRWAKNFTSVLNCSSANSDSAIDQLPHVDASNELNLPPFLS
ncbi:unnamed protein product [Schistocephalus solidus]|uniref:FERM domain-containing protein n=1 Tax=Schistocephalus solidus TaxID=70667 RepID=A0A183SDS6_SCHSO|nr:unnamed protein product [Schistocephalus solidus]